MGNELGGIKLAPQYFRDCVEELKKVSAPTRAETWQATLVTILIIAFVALVVACMDLIFGQIMSLLLG